MSMRETCGSCLSTDLDIILDLGHSPLANAYPATEYEHDYAPNYPLLLLICNACRLVQIGEVVADSLLWRGEYGYYSGTSPALVSHFQRYAADVIGRYDMRRDEVPFVVEVGSNDGTLLREFALEGWRALGIDPAAGPARMAAAAGLETIVDSFGSALAEAVASTYGEADLVIANNVAAHVADLDDFLAGLAKMMRRNGSLVMEVQYVADLLVGNGFDMVYHEHRFFYSLSSLAAALDRHELRVVDVEHVGTQGGSLRVTARSYMAVGNQLRSSAQRLHNVTNALYAERDLARRDAYDGLQARADRIGERLRAALREVRSAGATVAGYGAPAKATTLLHWTRTADYLSWVEDTTPAKIGRFMPGHTARIPIVAPGDREKPDAYLLMSHNYLTHILRREREFIDRGGRFIVPLPVPVVIGG